MTTVRITERCHATYPWMMFGYCFVRGIGREGTEGALADRQRELAAYIRQNRDDLSKRAKRISFFYRQQNEKNRSHIESLIKAVANGKEIKPVNVVVDAVMIAELQHALLLGVHDAAKLTGDVAVDVADGGETFPAIGGRTVVTRAGEVVLRDDLGIWASYTQGPDSRTIIDDSTAGVIILGFFTPDTSRDEMAQGLQTAVSTLTHAVGGDPGDIVILGP